MSGSEGRRRYDLWERRKLDGNTTFSKSLTTNIPFFDRKGNSVIIPS